MAARHTSSGSERPYAKGYWWRAGRPRPAALLLNRRDALPPTTTLDRRQRLLKIAKDIVHVLDADRDTHHPVSDADFAAAFLADSCVRHRRRMRNQGFDSAQGLGQRTHAHLAQHLVGVRERSGFEGDQRSEARHLPLR